jgi:hypothetical protein
MVVGRLSSALAIAAVVGCSSCGNNSNTALCTSYEQYLGRADAILATDATTVSPPEARDAVASLVDELDQLRSVSDGRYWATIDDLLVRVGDIGQVLASAPDDAEYETWEPLVADSLDDAIDSEVRLREVIDPVCAPDDVS